MLPLRGSVALPDARNARPRPTSAGPETAARNSEPRPTGACPDTAACSIKGLKLNDCPTYVYVRAVARHSALDASTPSYARRAHQLVKVGVAVDLAEREQAYKTESSDGGDDGVTVCAVLVEDRYMALAIEASVHCKIRDAMVAIQTDMAWPRGVNHLLSGNSSVNSEWSVPTHSRPFKEVVCAVKALGDLMLESARNISRTLSPRSVVPDLVKLQLALADTEAQRFRTVQRMPERMVQRAPRARQRAQPMERPRWHIRATDVIVGMLEFTQDEKDVLHHAQVRDLAQASELKVRRKTIRKALELRGALWSNGAVDRNGKRACGYLKVKVVERSSVSAPDGGSDTGAVSRSGFAGPDGGNCPPCTANS